MDIGWGRAFDIYDTSWKGWVRPTKLNQCHSHNQIHRMLEIVDDMDKTHYSDAELEEFRLVIEEKLDKARRELEFFNEQLLNSADNSDSKNRSIDDGTGTAENNQLAMMVARQQKIIQHLENALARISNKTYGVCRDTGKLIAKARLMAVPHATLSVEAKNNRK